MNPPMIGAMTTGPRMNCISPARRLALRFDHARSRLAPTTGSIAFAAAKTRLKLSVTSCVRSTASSTPTMIVHHSGHSRRSVSTITANVNPAAGKNAAPASGDVKNQNGNNAPSAYRDASTTAIASTPRGDSDTAPVRAGSDAGLVECETTGAADGAGTTPEPSVTSCVVATRPPPPGFGRRASGRCCVRAT